VIVSPTSPPKPTAWANGDELETRPLHSLLQVKLLGGDANNDNVIDISDSGCIGGAYGGGAAASETGSSDVNGDGKVDIYDLVLMGGNFYKNFSPWGQIP
jgi:hypothetical protein